MRVNSIYVTGHIQECLRRIGGGKPDEKGRENDRGRKTYTRRKISKVFLSSMCDKETYSLAQPFATAKIWTKGDEPVK